MSLPKTITLSRLDCAGLFACFLMLTFIVYAVLSIFASATYFEDKFYKAVSETGRLKLLLAAAQAQLSTTQADLRKANADHKKTQKSLKDVRQKLKAMQAEFDMLSVRLARAHSELATTRDDLSKTQDHVITQEQELLENKTSIESKDRAISNLCREVQLLHFRLSERSTETARQQQQQSLAQHAARMSEARQLRDEIASLRALCESWRTMNSATVHALQSRIGELEAECGGLKERNQRLVRDLWQALVRREEWRAVVERRETDEREEEEEEVEAEGEMQEVSGEVEELDEKYEGDNEWVEENDEQDEQVDNEWFEVANREQAEWLENVEGEDKWVPTGDVVVKEHEFVEWMHRRGDDGLVWVESEPEDKDDELYRTD